MKILVATVNHLLLIDLNTRTTSVIESNRQEYYGISWWENKDDLVLGHSGIKNDSLLALKDYALSEKGYISFGNKSTPCFLSQPHQLICAPDNMIIATNTGRNCVTLYNTTNGFYKDLRVNNIFWDRLDKGEPSGEHFNSVFLKNNRLYVLAHGFKKKSYVLEYDYPNCELINTHPIQQLTGLHNIWVDDDHNMFVCHSDAGELIEIKSNETVWSSGAAFYSRGFAVANDVMIIGDSEITERDTRSVSLTGIWIIDRKTFATIDYFTPGYFGSVHEIRIADEPDFAHNACVFSGLSALQSAHENMFEARRQEKLKISRQQYDQSSCTFYSILNGFTTDAGGWMSAKQNGLGLGIAKTKPLADFNISIDYLFNASEASQHLSLVVGYQGPDDTNMYAILLNKNPNESVSMGLWHHNQTAWEFKETLLTQLADSGTFSISRTNEQLEIKCNQSKIIYKKLTTQALEGGVGVRAYGAHFKNFQYINKANNNEKKFIQKLIERSFLLTD